LEIKYDEEKVRAQSEYHLSSLIGAIKDFAKKRDMLFELDEDNTMRVSIKRDKNYGYIASLAYTLLLTDWFPQLASVFTMTEIRGKTKMCF